MTNDARIRREAGDRKRTSEDATVLTAVRLDRIDLATTVMNVAAHDRTTRSIVARPCPTVRTTVASSRPTSARRFQMALSPVASSRSIAATRSQTALSGVVSALPITAASEPRPSRTIVAARLAKRAKKVSDRRRRLKTRNTNGPARRRISAATAASLPPMTLRPRASMRSGTAIALRVALSPRLAL